jgi:hypothetical protein
VFKHATWAGCHTTQVPAFQVVGVG